MEDKTSKKLIATKTTSKATANANKPPPKKEKRTHSEVSEDSQNNSSLIDVLSIQANLDTISADLGELKGSMQSMLKKDEIETLIQSTVSRIITSMEKKMKEEVDLRVTEKTKDLWERVQVLEYDNRQLTDRLEKSEKEMKRVISDLSEREKQNDWRSRDAMKRANFNEQYSRKNNVKIAGIGEERGETQTSLEGKVLKLFSDNDIDLKKEDILAMHRIPSKRGDTRPVLIKTINNESKATVMRKRKAMKGKGLCLIDDVTALNTGLINRLSNHEEITSSWFFNGYVYGKTAMEERIRFDIYDNITEVISAYRQKRKSTNRQ